LSCLELVVEDEWMPAVSMVLEEVEEACHVVTEDRMYLEKVGSALVETRVEDMLVECSQRDSVPSLGCAGLRLVPVPKR
jgi:hypothetical protein